MKGKRLSVGNYRRRRGALLPAVALLPMSLLSPAWAQNTHTMPGTAPTAAPYVSRTMTRTTTDRTAPAGDVIVNMRDIDIAQVAEQVSRITGHTLILDPSVKGVVNVVSAEPLSPSGVWDLFRSVLRVYGFAAVKSGAAYRIVPQASAVQTGGEARGPVRSADVITRVIPLRNLPADAAVRAFRPLIASFGSLEALPNPNSIVVTDYAENVRRIERLAAQLDRGGGTGFVTQRLRYASAADVGPALQKLFGEANTPGAPRIAVDERSNTVLVRGDARVLAETRQLIGQLDRPGGSIVTTRVFRLNFSDAETVAGILRGLNGDQAAATNPAARSLTRNSRLGGGGFGGSGFGGGGPNSGFGSGGNSSSYGGMGSGFGGGLGGANVGAGGASAALQGLTSGGTPGLGSATGSSGTSSTPHAGGFTAGDLQIQPAPELNAIVVRGSPAAIAALDPLITELDVRRPQVMIEAAIVEVTGEVAEQLGIQMGFGNAAVIDGGVAGTSFSNSGVPLTSIIQLLNPGNIIGAVGDGLTVGAGSRNQFSILLQALGTSTKANLLSTPSITTLDNEEAQIVVGQNVPFRTGSFATTGNTITPFTTIERQDVGITLRVVPRIHEGDSIRLEVAQEVSSLVPAVTGAADLITNRRSIQTVVLADNGQTIILGGLITDDRSSSRSQVPVLGDIPVVGNLFKSRRESTTKRTLFVFLRPTILRDRASVVAAAADKYARLRAQELGNPMRSLLLRPPGPRLPLEISGVY